MEMTWTRRLTLAAALLGASALLMALVAATTAPPAHALETPGGFKKQIQKCKKKYDGKAQKKCIKKLTPRPQPVPTTPAPAPAGQRPTSLTLSCTDCGPGNTHAPGTVQVAGDITPAIAGAYEPIRLDYGGLSPQYLYPNGGHYQGSFGFGGGTVTVMATFPGSFAGNFAPSSATITVQG
jgi:hypothetical protein